MTTPAVDRKTRRLLTQLAALEGALNGLARSFPGMGETFAAAKDLREEMDKPVSEVIATFAPYSGIDRTGAVCSVGTTGGREL